MHSLNRMFTLIITFPKLMGKRHAHLSYEYKNLIEGAEAFSYYTGEGKPKDVESVTLYLQDDAICHKAF